MNVFLTGATGLVGGELLVTLSKHQKVGKIYCLVRAKSNEDAMARIEKIFDLHGDFLDKGKVKCVIGDLNDEELTNKLCSNKELDEINAVIHSAANTSFSRIYDDLVEKTNIHGLNRIVQWAKKVDALSTFMYIGTATICGNDVKNKVIFEDESPNENANHLVKYTYTKMQGELLLQRELPKEKILVARPSIIMGDSRDVMPRSPVILWALATINALRLCPFGQESRVDIISVDFAAEAIVKLLFANRKYNVYHISSGIQSSTRAIQTLNTIAPYFKDHPDYIFAEKELFQKLKKWSKGQIGTENGLAQYRTYLDYWEELFEDKSKLRIIFAGLEPYIEFINLGHIFDNSRLMEDIDIHQPIPAHEYVKNSIEYMKNINILEGAFDS